jgi:hypothetical protein
MSFFLRRSLLRFASRVYRLMLLAYPRRFRDEYSREMMLVFENRARDVVHKGGSWALVPFSVSILWDWLQTTASERTDVRAQQTTHAIAALQLVLIFPAALFLTAVVVRYVPPLHDDAQRIVMLYAGKVWTLWVLLLTLPLCVLVTGCATLLRGWNRDVELPNAARQSLIVALGQPPATLFVAAATLAAAGILATIILHMLAH